MSKPQLNFYPLKNQILSLLQTPKPTSHLLQIHAQLITTNFVSDPFIASRLLDLNVSSKCRDMSYANLIFRRIQEPNTFIWNTMVKGYTSSSNPQKAFRVYIEMRLNGLPGDNYTYPFVLKGCGMMGGMWEGRQVHGEVVKVGREWDLFVRNGLIGMYCKCGEMGCCRDLFDGFGGKDMVSWNLVLSGYAKCGEMVEAQKVFDEMPDRDVASWSIMIDGYGKKTGDVVRARLLFDSMPVRDMVTWNSMIDSFSKVGDMMAARQLFDVMVEKNVISWSIMIDGYARHGDPKEALNLFRQMLYLRVKPDHISVVGAISACAQLGALDQGRWIHIYMKKNKITLDLVVQTALMDMYMKCGSIDEACEVFHSTSQRNVITWNVMVSGFGMNGFGEAALKYFSQMEREGIKMDDLIFVSVLTACSHAGFVTEGLDRFQKMRSHGVEPKLEHYGCLIDLLGRAGLLEKARIVIESMSMRPNPELWGALLLACRTHRKVALAESVVERLVELEADDCGVYVLMSNIYADAGMWEGVTRIRKLIRERNMKMDGGKSVIEVNGDVEEFICGKKANIRNMEIEGVLCSLLNVVASVE